MVAVSKTLGPIHFEDLDPKRFESLVRALLYDFKDWNNVQSTGIAGSDEGFDIRAWEKKYIPSPSENEAETDTSSVIPVDGKLWMIQCKRESEIGPKRVGKIIDEGIPDKDNAPHGYILVAPANFSKKSFDKFTAKLQEKGVSEFHLWGKPDLESMLMQPKFDHVLFSFFGISIIAKSKSKASKVKSIIANKNKLFRILGDDKPNTYHSILVRDIEDEEYPYQAEYDDFEKNPRWIEVVPNQYYPTGVVVHIKQHFGYVDETTKQWDCIKTVDTMHRESENKYFKKPDENEAKARDIWRHLRNDTQATIYLCGFIKYKDILAIDDKGDVEYDFPHIYLNRDIKRGLFPFQWLEAEKFGDFHNSKKFILKQDGYKKAKVFPAKLPEITKGTFHKSKKIELDTDTLVFLKNSYVEKSLLDMDGRYSYLSTKDIVEFPGIGSDSISTKHYVEILHKYETTLAAYLGKDEKNTMRKELAEKQLGREIELDKKITVYEFEQTYHPE